MKIKGKGVTCSSYVRGTRGIRVRSNVSKASSGAGASRCKEAPSTCGSYENQGDDGYVEGWWGMYHLTGSG